MGAVGSGEDGVVEVFRAAEALPETDTVAFPLPDAGALLEPGDAVEAAAMGITTGTETVTTCLFPLASLMDTT